MSEETWRTIPGYSRYEVSSAGQVRSWVGWRDGRRAPAPRPLTPHRRPDGYAQIRLTADTGLPRTLKIHQLVAWAFLGEQIVDQVRHLDGDRSNNAVKNLAYGTRGQNTLDSVAHGTHNMSRKSHCVNGHAFTPDNTYLRPTGGRRCRTCQRATGASAARRSRKKAEDR